MRSIVVTTILSLDGVMQSPARPNSTLLKGDAAQAVAALKEQPGKDIGILGSGQLIRSLMRRNLIDRYVLLIHLLMLGSGRRLFPDGAPYSALRLIGSVITTKGVMIATYQAAGGEMR